MRFAALRGSASFSFAPVLKTLQGSAASGTAVVRTVKYSFNARPKQSKPGPRLDVDAGTRTSNIQNMTDAIVGAARRGRPSVETTFFVGRAATAGRPYNNARMEPIDADVRIGRFAKFPAMRAPSGPSKES